MGARSLCWSSTSILIALTSVHAAAGQFGPVNPVDPFEVRSPDGAWSLFVDPSSPDGDGPATYRLSQGSQAAWTKELPGTLRDVRLAEDGTFAGTSQSEKGLRLMLVAPDGTARLDSTLPYEGAMMHGPSFPLSNGVVLDLEHDAIVFRVQHDLDGDHFETWHFAQLSTGEVRETVRLVPPLEERDAVCRLGGLRPIAGTPLFACAWCESTYSGSARGRAVGVRFVVADRDANTVWELELPNDLEVAGDKGKADRLWRWAVGGGGLLEGSAPRRFEAVFAAEAQRVAFEVSADAAEPGGWKVSEAARAAYVIPLDEPSERAEVPAPGRLPLKFLGAIELQSVKAATGECHGFDIDDRGRLGQVVAGQGKQPRFELRDSDGVVRVDIPLQLGPEAEKTAPATTWLLGDRWLLYAKTWGDEAPCFAWWFDLPAGTLTEIPDFDCAPIEKADGLFDGGFVALTAKHLEYTIETTLSAFDAQGKLRWRDTEAYGQSEDGLLSPEDVRVSPKGEIGVLDNIRHLIQRFDLEGKLVSAIELDPLLGHEANYPTELGVDADGNWVVYDFGGSPPVLRVSRDGALTSTFTPGFDDGRVFLPKDGIHVAPDGRLWATDGYALLRLDETGLVDRIAGDAPNSASLGEIERAFIDPFGRTLLADERTHAVHVFDGEGKRLAVCRLAPADVDEQTEVGNLAVSSEGNVHVGLGDFEIGKYRGFSGSGEPLGSDPFMGRVLFQPGKSRRWEVSYDEIRLCEAKTGDPKTIRRTPGNRWLYSNDAASVAADGSLAVISRGELHIYSPEGEPMMSIQLPDGSGYAEMAFADTRVFLDWGATLWCIDLASRRVSKATLGSELSADASTLPCWRTEGSELWILDESELEVLRYRVPR